MTVGWSTETGGVSVTGDIDRPSPEELLRVAYFCVVTLLDTLAGSGAEALGLALDDDAVGVELQIVGRMAIASPPDPTSSSWLAIDWKRSTAASPSRRPSRW